MDIEGNETPEATQEIPEEQTEASKEASDGKQDKSQVGSSAGSRESNSKESKPASSDDEEFETVRSANREWKLPKDAANTFKHLEKSYRNATKELASIKKKAILEEDPDKIIEQALSKKGLTRAQWAEQALQKHLEDLEKDPRDKELEDLRREKEEREKNAVHQRKLEEQKKKEELTQFVRKEIDTEVAKAMQEADIVPSAYAAKQMSAVMYESMQLVKAGKIPRILTAREAADIVKEEQNSTWIHNVQKLKPEQVFEILGETKFNELKQWELTRLQEKASKAGLVKKSFGSSSKEPSQSAGKSNRYLSEKEYRQLYED